MTYLTEKDQIELFSKWWKENGLAVVTAVVVLLGSYLGWTAWQTHQETQAAKASEIFQSILDLQKDKAGDKPQASMAELADQLKKDYSQTYYGQAVRLILAQDAVKNGQLETAEAELTALVNQKPGDVLLYTARLRLASVLYAQGKFDAALAQLNGSTPEAYKSLFAELRGDAFAGKNDVARARESYNDAMAALQKNNEESKQAIEMKLNALNVVQ